MKLCRKICTLSILILILAMSCTSFTFASVAYDSQKPVSLEIEYKYDEKALSGALFDIYYVAGIDIYGEITTSDNFSSFDSELQNSDEQMWEGLIEKLEQYVVDNNIVPNDYGKTDESGSVVFPNNCRELEKGIYLVVGHDLMKEYDKYKTSSFLISLPNTDKNGNWIYEVVAEPKVEYTPNFYFEIPPEDNPGYGNDIDKDKEPKPNDDTERLPQTGQLWWPVPILLALGISFIVVGLFFNKGNRNEK